VVEQGGVVRGILLPKAAPYSRKQVDDLIAFIKPFGATGLVPIQYLEEEIRTPVSKFLSEEILKSILERFGAKIGDIIFLVASKEKVVCDSLGNLRNKFGAEYKLYDSNTYKALWVTEFPLLDWDQDAGRFVAMHHPFTSPHPDDIPLMETDPGKIRARAYDLVLNGSEVAGGSIRIHQSSVQAKMFDLLGITEETAKIKFGYLIEALNYGAPPHGGIAFGFDRLVAMLAKEGSIREVIAFPKTTSALSLMDGCPSQVDSDQLEELGLKLDDEISVD
jgi:aspartyl-tRNA synthetase